MFKGDLNEDRWEVKHDSAQIVRNVWKAQPTHNSKGVHQTGLKKGMLRGNDPQARQQGHTGEGIQAGCLPHPAQCPAGVSSAGFGCCHLTAAPGAAAGNETPLTGKGSRCNEKMKLNG